jgi:hypothetical protein
MELANSAGLVDWNTWEICRSLPIVRFFLLACQVFKPIFLVELMDCFDLIPAA